MTEITPQMIKTLRERTGVGVGKCKDALQEAGGDIEKAISVLRKAGMATAVKKEERETREGTICAREAAGRLALVEVNAETDFVVKNERFQEFAKNIAEEVAKTQPATVADFLQQTYSRDAHLTIDQYRAVIVQSLGENIRIRRFQIFAKKKQHSLAAYLHLGGKLATLVELSGAEGEEELAKQIAMHVAAEAPEYLSPAEVPEKLVEQEKEIARAQIRGKPEQVVEKILAGKLKAYYDQVCLLNQRFVRNPELTIQELLEARSKEIGVQIQVAQFIRWQVGG